MSWYDKADVIQGAIRQARSELEELRDAVMRELGSAEAEVDRLHEVVAAMDRELDDANGEILRHHKDFTEISRIATDHLDTEQDWVLRDGLKKIRNIVG